MAIRGHLHLHLTVDASPAEVPALRAWAEARGLRCTHIVLARGDTPSQPMITWQVDGDADARLADGRRLARALEDAGFTPLRLKLEAAPDATGVPEDEPPPEGRYFEHHVKLALDPSADPRALLAVLAPHAAHLSQNAIARASDGREHRFATQRIHGVGRARAKAELDLLVSALIAHGYAVVEAEQEYTIYDSHAALDRGWLEGG